MKTRASSKIKSVKEPLWMPIVYLYYILLPRAKFFIKSHPQKALSQDIDQAFLESERQIYTPAFLLIFNKLFLSLFRTYIFISLSSNSPVFGNQISFILDF